jgi:hypothetical protein
LEFVPESYIQSYRVYPNIQDSTVRIEITARAPSGTKISLAASFSGTPMGQGETKVCNGIACAVIPLEHLYLWDVGQPNLYDLTLAVFENLQDRYAVRAPGHFHLLYDGKILCGD